jgi:hypothetical protein
LKVTLVTLGPLKLWPWIVTEVPTGPLAGENDEIVGAAAQDAGVIDIAAAMVPATIAARMRVVVLG